jgi:hypothetical protein
MKPTIFAAISSADQQRPLAGIVARQRAHKIADQMGVATFPDMQRAEMTDGKGAVVVPHGE